jgi:imidazolonepropionase-like amidohydrolase
MAHRRHFVFFAALIFAVLLLPEFAFKPSVAQTPASGAIALTGARLIDGTGGAPLEMATLVMRNGRVESVGPAASITIPAGATRIDVTGKTVIPGLINAHAHVNASDESTLPVRDQLLAQLRLYSAYGVTTAFVLGSTDADLEDALRLRDEQERSELARSRIYVSSPSVRDVKTPEDARRRADRDAGLKVDGIKMHINGNAADMTPEVYGALIEQAHKRGLRTAAHLYYTNDAWGLLKAGIDIFAHSVRDKDIDAAMIAELKRRNIGYIPTLTRDLSVFVYETTPPFFADPFFLRRIADYRSEMTRLSDPALQERTRNSAQAQTIKKALEQASRNLKILADAGAPIAMGTDTGAGDGRWQGYFEHVELELMVKAGLTPMQALVAATGGAARVMKLDLGANPLADIRNTRQIDSVWIGGKRVTLQTAGSGL